VLDNRSHTGASEVHIDFIRSPFENSAIDGRSRSGNATKNGRQDERKRAAVLGERRLHKVCDGTGLKSARRHMRRICAGIGYRTCRLPGNTLGGKE
jgi:hypothetical protein